ncbi:MAG: hypothetical protein [Caudoviricetes sp.]|nr:MAG: hypothetical protein [Caudoviricetes sp.]
MKVLDLDYADLEARYWASKVYSLIGDATKVYFSTARRCGKSWLTQKYMEQAYDDLMRQGRTVLTATRAKLSHNLDEIQQPMKRVGQPITLDAFRKSALSIQLTMALSKDVV